MSEAVALPESSALLEAANRFLPELATRRREIDEARQLPQDLADRMADAGLYKLVTPKALGGLDVGPRLLCEICETLATANGSAAWCVFIGSTSQYLLGALDDQQREIMLALPKLITSGVFADSGTVCFEERDGAAGYVVNGHWRWGSGCRNAHWISGGIHEVDAAGEAVEREVPLTRVFFKPEEVEILDNWHVSGLRGSGSSDYRVQDLWVPAHRLAGVVQKTQYGTHPIYQFPQFGLLGLPIGAIAMGMARASIDALIELAGTKTPQGSRRSLAMRTGLHRDVAVLDTELRAAHALFYQTIDEAWQTLQSSGSNLDMRYQLRTSTFHAVSTAVKVVDKMYTLAGGTSVFEESVLQQHFRDVHVATQHMMVGEPVMELAGRVLIGLDDRAQGL